MYAFLLAFLQAKTTSIMALFKLLVLFEDNAQPCSYELLTKLMTVSKLKLYQLNRKRKNILFEMKSFAFQNIFNLKTTFSFKTLQQKCKSTISSHD